MLQELNEIIIENNLFLKDSPLVKETKHKTYGINLPTLRKIAKKIAKEKRYDFFEEKHTCFDEFIIHAYAIGYLKEDISTCITYAEKFLPQIDNWAVNDSFCQNLLWAKKYPNETYMWLKKHLKSKKEFYVRVIEVTYLSHFLIDEYIDLVYEDMQKLYLNTYMSKMGYAWLIATMMGKYPDKTLIYLKECKLDNFTFNKSIQKIKESFRVDENIKLMVEKMRK